MIEIEVSQRDGLIKGLTDAYRSDPSSAIHGATGWLLRKWGFNPEVTKVDHSPLPYDETGTRQWYVLEVSPEATGTTDVLPGVPAGDKAVDKKIHFTFVVFRPGEYMMGSPREDYADHDVDERLHRVTLTRSWQ